ncbi:MAG: PilN domain-containing protein [bacterium]
MQLAIGESRDLQNQTHELKAKLEHEKQRDYLLRNQISIDPASRMCSIEAIVPVNTEISRINLSRNKLSLTGQATKPQDIALFLQQLQRLYGNNIRLTTCQLKADSRYYFQMEGEGIRY